MDRARAVILGGGAAGLMCARQIALDSAGARVVVIEHNQEIGRKILISGGGRCNFTNRDVSAANFVSTNPHFAKSALAGFRPADFIALVEQHRIAYHEKTLGQLFCDGSARQIVEMLRSECVSRGVEIRENCRITDVRKPVGAGGEFVVETSQGEFTADTLVIATGGLSIPKMGATGFGYQLACRFGLKVVECRPGLVPLILADLDRKAWCDLSGVSVEATVAVESGPGFREKLLITHRGLSGPAILQASTYWQPGEGLAIALAGEFEAALFERKRSGERAGLKHVLGEMLPRRFGERWVEVAGLDGVRPVRELPDRIVGQIAEGLKNWRIVPAGTEGFEKAEVTAGGVDTGELSSQTMESKKAPGTFWIGEVVDVTGWLGGYNFQWAWASAVAAGRAIARRAASR